MDITDLGVADAERWSERISELQARILNGYGGKTLSNLRLSFFIRLKIKTMKNYKGPYDDDDDDIFLSRPKSGGGTNDGGYIWVG